MPRLIDEEGKSLKLLTWGANLFTQGGSTDPGRNRECQAVMGLCGHNIHQNPPRQRGQSNAMARGKSSPTFSK